MLSLPIGSRVLIAGSAWDSPSALGPGNPIECHVERVEAGRVLVKPLEGYCLRVVWAEAGEVVDVLEIQ